MSLIADVVKEFAFSRLDIAYSTFRSIQLQFSGVLPAFLREFLPFSAK
jgi:hypothetical protein